MIHVQRNSHKCVILSRDGVHVMYLYFKCKYIGFYSKSTRQEIFIKKSGTEYNNKINPYIIFKFNIFLDIMFLVHWNVQVIKLNNRHFPN